MRPSLLDCFFQDISCLNGIGDKMKVAYTKLCGGRFVDVAFHIPRQVIVRHPTPNITHTDGGQTIIAPVRIVSHSMPSRRGQPLRVTASNHGRKISLIFFNGSSKYWAEHLPVGGAFVIAGRTELFNESLQIVHPDIVQTITTPIDDDAFPDDILGTMQGVRTLDPVYPLSAGITHKGIQKTVAQILDKLPPLPEWLDPALVKQENWSDWNTTIARLHTPNDPMDLNNTSPYRRRLAYDELFANQLALQIIRHKRKKLRGQAIQGNNALRSQILHNLPFDLTPSQHTALAEIYADMAQPERMLRLLQGDVGSGKTLVALLAMLCAVECGGQACLMAPTEILARQHYDTIAPMVEKLGLKIAVLTSRDKGKSRAEILSNIANGTTHIIIGTHALFQDDVIYSDLKMAVIDEQHRFGVEQRLHLSRKGDAVDMLVMTATPIPRSLALSVYGDMDTSQLTEKPAGRKPIDTRLLSHGRLNELMDKLAPQIANGTQLYWVCPLVEESETMDYTAVQDRYAHLCQYFGDDAVAMVHGKMKAPEKDSAMERFISGQAKILVATTVIEVGVNVPNASIMVVEHAERFGLAQLHQLRGRIGRGSAHSTCMLLYGDTLSDTAQKRLETLRDTDDGFVIAEQDLTLRGYGEILGTKQSGVADFTFVDLAEHADLLPMATQNAKLILDKNPDLQGDGGENLRLLLYLFERDSAFHTLHSG